MKCPVERECRRRSSLHEKLLAQAHRKASRLCSLCSCRLTILSPVSSAVHREQRTSADAEILDRLHLGTAKSPGGVSCAMTATLSVVSKHPKDAQSLALTNLSRELNVGSCCPECVALASSGQDVDII